MPQFSGGFERDIRYKPDSLYVIDAASPIDRGSLRFEVLTRDPDKKGAWGKPKSQQLRRDGLATICQAGQCRLRLRPDDPQSQWLAIAWDDGEPWQLRLEVRRAQENERYELAGVLRRGAERMELTTPVMLAAAGVFFTRDKAARYEHNGAFNWVQLLRAHSPLLIPAGQREEFLAIVLRQPVLPPLDLPEDWQLKGEGRVYRSAGELNLRIQSGIDWFELHGAVKFGDTAAHLPELLAAMRRGETAVKLADGTFGLLPQEWLKKYGLLVSLGAEHEDHLRFSRSQVGLLDALLAAQPEVQCDALVARARDELRNFAGIQAAEPPAGFVGELRLYQKDGLGWFDFLRQFGFGGCLADDMGLGKTVQVLALLEARRESRFGPSLIVMPKSLIFNWHQEAARFTPRLRLLDHTGSSRRKGNKHFKDYDVVLTTYGTLRNDARDFKDVHFDYLILDEAQAIKNAGSVSAKAARLLRGEHRLALSGTPIENHLGELWSLFEFLNPGMLGAASVFKLTHGAVQNPDEETRKLLAQAIRPFVLRRTKAQVVRDLPPKVEQTLYCELESKQRKLYDELRAHYRHTLLGSIEKSGMGQAKIQILEALLRLRQAALHPGLLDERRTGESSAKLDMLLPQLREVLDEGHKTLVFSQFTGMLAILREHLDRDGLAYEYLDGKTRDRQACVERFQTDPDCKLFLISLKAGGLGLNLTAAQYVFLLDPWWNPAVEAQAIDRAHRIGQTNRVFAYRLIARDTVEEKVLELQNTKRNLADAIVNADNALIRDLGREDLELLLS